MNLLNILDLRWISNSVKKNILIFLVGFCIYPTIEIVWNTILTPYGYKIFAGQLSMAILGGVLMVILGNLNEIKLLRNNLTCLGFSILGGVIVTALELVTGLIVNVGFGWHVWDYSDMPLNIMGQVCALYSIFWVVLSPVAFWLDDIFRLAYDELTGSIIKKSYSVYNLKSKASGPRTVMIGTIEDLSQRYKSFIRF